MGAPFEDPDRDGAEKLEELDVVIVQDEVARLYQTSPRAEKEFPTMPPLTRYFVALARYMQGPILDAFAIPKDMTQPSTRRQRKKEMKKKEV